MQKQPLIYQLPGIPPIKMIPISGGTFIMGKGNDDDNPAHEVRMDGFYLCEFPVTQDLYNANAQNNPSGFKGNRRPVENVSWYDAIEFCNLLSKKLGLEKVYSIDKETKDKTNTNEYDKIKWDVKTNNKAKGFRLPTEAEWEYATQGGSSTTYSGSNRLEQVGWFEGNDYEETREVGLKFPNKLGLYDMSGNVWEWCWDWYVDLYPQTRDNPTGVESGWYRILHGGSWDDAADNCQIVNRDGSFASHRSYSISFRIALNLHS